MIHIASQSPAIGHDLPNSSIFLQIILTSQFVFHLAHLYFYCPLPFLFSYLPSLPLSSIYPSPPILSHPCSSYPTPYSYPVAYLPLPSLNLSLSPFLPTLQSLYHLLNISPIYLPVIPTPSSPPPLSLHPPTFIIPCI